jgi:hypothetical protein
MKGEGNRGQLMGSRKHYTKLLAWTALLWFLSGFVSEAGGRTLNIVWESVAEIATDADSADPTETDDE